MKKHSLIILFLLVAFCSASVFSQEKSVSKKDLTPINLQKTPSSENKCWKYGTQDFVGKTVSIEFADQDIREVVDFFQSSATAGLSLISLSSRLR